MIPRYLRILFWTLLLASVAMAVVLIRLRERAADRISGRYADAQASEAAASPAAPEESVTLLEASDADGTIAPVTRKLALPQETGARARVLLRRLLADYAAPGSKHPLAANLGVEPPGTEPPAIETSGVEEVFFMPISPAGKSGSSGTTGSSASNETPQTAIVNLTGAFAENHPSGIEAETLTLLSIIGTLHENFPAVVQVRFLVDGQPRETLAGHADLTRTYVASGSDTR